MNKNRFFSTLMSGIICAYAQLFTDYGLTDINYWILLLGIAFLLTVKQIIDENNKRFNN